MLDHLGEEITSIAWPVSLCMAITVFLVRVLNPDGVSSAVTVAMANAIYDEGANVRLTARHIDAHALLYVHARKCMCRCRKCAYAHACMQPSSTCRYGCRLDAWRIHAHSIAWFDCQESCVLGLHVWARRLHMGPYADIHPSMHTHGPCSPI